MVKRNFKAIGNFLREKRQQRELTQGEVAKPLGFLSAQFISNIERGLALPPLNCLRKMIELYDIEEDEIIDLLVEEERKYIRSVIYGKVQLPQRKIRKKWKKRR